MPESVKYWRDQSFGGIDVLTADFDKRAFSVHAHDEWAICSFQRGAQRFVANGVERIATAGTICIIPPLVEHDGCAATEERRFYEATYPEEEVLERLLGAPARLLLGTEVLNVSDPTVFQSLSLAHRTMNTTADVLEKEETYAHAMDLLIAHIGSRPVFDHAASISVGPKVRRAREYVETRYGEDSSIDVIAQAVGLSAAHLTRAFRRAYGLHLHGYVTQVRLRQARSMLLAGASPAETALATGFVDQSHLIRRFKQNFGGTPGAYVSTSRIHQLLADATGASAFKSSFDAA